MFANPFNIPIGGLPELNNMISVAPKMTRYKEGKKEKFFATVALVVLHEPIMRFGISSHLSKEKYF